MLDVAAAAVVVLRMTLMFCCGCVVCRTLMFCCGCVVVLLLFFVVGGVPAAVAVVYRRSC